MEFLKFKSVKNHTLEAKLQSQVLTHEERNAIEELREPIRNIIEQIKPELEKGEFSIIIGDDASGRIPALIMGHIAKIFSERNGHSTPRRLFLAGSHGLDKKPGVKAQKEIKMREYIDSLGSPKKALIVTDVISTGKTLEMLTRALREGGWTVAVATIGLSSSDEKEELEERLGARIVIGVLGVPKIYIPIEYGGGKEAAGVRKDPQNLFSERSDTPSARVVATRILSKAIAQKIADET